MKTQNVFRVGIVLIAGAALTACGAPGQPAAQGLAANAVENVGCKMAQSELWSGLQNIADQGEEFPDSEQVRKALVKEGEQHGLKGPNFDQYVEAFVSNYETTIVGIKSKLAPGDIAGWKKALAQMEIGVRITDVHAELNDQIEKSTAKLALADAGLKATCSQPATPETPTHTVPKATHYDNIWDQLKAEAAPEVYGARKTLAIAYQSCDVLKLDPMNAKTPSTEGIADIGTRPDGGHIRKIASLASVNSTDYYIHNMSLPKNTCFEVRNDPLIYNFGGKPFTTSKDSKLLDLFTHTSGGGPTLGIDCSGYVFSALAMAGLKLDTDPKSVLKADLVWGVGSGAFFDPQNNHLRCLQKISVTKTTSIKAGDIVAINGHVIMIDSIGDDPFGLKNFSKASDCTTAKMNIDNFDFVIAQSAPIKGGIGINRIHAKDYLPESKTIRTGLQAYAAAACRVKFGSAANLVSPSLSVVRHSKTAECMAPQALTMTREECVDSCPAL